MMNLLAIPYGYEAPIGEALLYAGIGLLVVFLGIALLVLIVWLLGLAMNKFTAVQKKEKTTDKVETTQAPVQKDELDDQTVAVITAAIAAYYQKQQIPCEFVIKKIKRYR